MTLNIRTRLFAFSLGVILLGASLTAATLIFLELEALEYSHQHFGKEFAEITGKHAIDAYRTRDIDQMNKLLGPLIHEDDFVQHLFIDTDGTVLAGGNGNPFSDNTPATEVIPYIERLNESNKTVYWFHDENIAITRRVADSSGNVVGYFHLELSRDDIRQETRSIILRLIPVGFILAIFSYFAARWLTGFFHSPLQQAVTAADEIANGNYNITLSETMDRSDEFGDLNRALTVMSRQIRTSIDELNETRLELEEMFNVMVDGVILTNIDGDIQRLNQRMITMTSRAQDALIGQHISILFKEETSIEELSGSSSEKTILSDDYNEIAVQVSASLIHPAHKAAPIGSVLLIHDLSDRIRAERQEQYAAFQSGVAQMSASVLHNIGNVVTGMSGNLIHARKGFDTIHRLSGSLGKYADTSDELLNSPEDEESIQNRLKESSTLLRSLTKGLGSISTKVEHIDTLERAIVHIGEIISIQQNASRPIMSATSFDMHNFIEDTISLIEDRLIKSGIQWQSHIAVGITKVKLPKNPLIQLLLNLLKNSLEAINERKLTDEHLEGVIEIHVEHPDDATLLLLVEDNGCGILHHQLQQIFAAHHTTKKTGSGYGLHSASNFVRQLGGDIVAESEGLNRGSRFKVTLPIAEDGTVKQDPAITS